MKKRNEFLLKLRALLEEYNANIYSEVDSYDHVEAWATIKIEIEGREILETGAYNLKEKL